MVDMFVKDGKIDAEAEVLTYLHILETQVRSIICDLYIESFLCWSGNYSFDI